MIYEIMFFFEKEAIWHSQKYKILALEETERCKLEAVMASF
jgi:hypothetical protein